MPIRTEGSVDEDLLEDSSNRLADYLRRQGYWRALVEHRRGLEANRLADHVQLQRGRCTASAGIEISGNAAVARGALIPLITVKAQGAVRRGARSTPTSRRLPSTTGASGTRRSKSTRSSSNPPETAAATVGDGSVSARIAIVEGPRTIIVVGGVHGWRGAPGRIACAERLRPRRGGPYYRPDVAADREAILLRYLNRGYQTASVDTGRAASATTGAGWTSPFASGRRTAGDRRSHSHRR